MRVRLGHERGKPPCRGTSLLTTPQTQCGEVPGAVVAQQAVDVRYRQKSIRDVSRLLIPHILHGSACHHAAHIEIEFAGLVAVGPLGGDQLFGHLVIRLALLQ